MILLFPSTGSLVDGVIVFMKVKMIVESEYLKKNNMPLLGVWGITDRRCYLCFEQ